MCVCVREHVCCVLCEVDDETCNRETCTVLKKWDRSYLLVSLCQDTGKPSWAERNITRERERKRQGGEGFS